MEIVEAAAYVAEEVVLATKKFPPMRSPHEGLAIILEEYEELKDEVFKQHDVRDKLDMRHEAKQLAAMAVRFMMDLT